MLFSAQEAAALTPAGLQIQNTASVTYSSGADTRTAVSNTVSTTVAQVFGVTVTSTGGADVSVGGVAHRCLGFRVTNTGNGPARYALSTTIGQGVQPVSTAIYLDTVADNVCDPAHDEPYSPGAGDPLLNADQSIQVWVLVRLGDGSGAPAPVTLNAQAQAVQASATAQPSAPVTQAQVAPVAPAPEENATLVKSQTVVDANGGSRPLPGAVITYTLKAQFTGTGAASGVVLSDPIPAGSTYLPGSLRLDGAVLSDASDGDVGRVDANGVSVSLGDVAGQVDHTVSFQVRINQIGASS